jgi:small neutral amino acid transporter SnatA (MarC family)
LVSDVAVTTRHHRIMTSLNLADMLALFLSVIGPQKVLLSFARIAQVLDASSVRLVAVIAAVASASVGLVCAFTAPWLATFFDISTAALELAAGVAFFVYALALVFGIHVDLADPARVPEFGTGPVGGGGGGGGDRGGGGSGGGGGGHSGDGGGGHGGGAGAGAEADPDHPISSGVRTLLLPWVVSPLAVAAVLEESLIASGWGDRWVEAIAFALIAALNAVCGIVLGPLLGRTHDNVLEVFSRLLGILLAAVGVQLFLIGLTTLGVIHSSH